MLYVTRVVCFLYIKWPSVLTRKRIYVCWSLKLFVACTFNTLYNTQLVSWGVTCRSGLFYPMGAHLSCRVFVALQ